MNKTSHAPGTTQPGIKLPGIKLSLLHYGLMLVAIPLCFEMIIFSVLLIQQNQVEQEAKRIDRNRQIALTVTELIQGIISVGDIAQFFELSPGDLNTRPSGKIEQVERKLYDLRGRFNRVKILSTDEPKTHRQLEMCGKAFALAGRDLIQMGQSALRAPSEKMADALVHSARHKVWSDLHLCLGAGLLELGQESLDRADDLSSRKFRETTRLTLKCALALSIVMASSTAIAFSLSLKGMLTRMRSNTKRLATGEPLLDPIAGEHEIAKLDRTIHYASDQIQAAKRIRQEVTAMITHDLKTPLQAISGFHEMLEARLLGDLNEQGLRLMANAENASKQMASLIDSVLQLEKLRTGSANLKSEPVDLAPLLIKCVETVTVLADLKQVTLQTRLEHKGKDLVLADVFWLQEVLINLLSNAIKFTADKSTVEVSTGKAGSHLEIAIADQGPGIAKEEVELIFERFHRVKATAGVPGSGLGLTIAKELIELHKGTIEVRSEVGKGSTFIVRLPICQTESAPD